MDVGRILCAIALALLASSGQAADPITRGQHLATLMGCTSCHGTNLQGHLHEGDAQFATWWNSNLSLILPRWTAAQIESALRTGRRPDGTPLWFMPTFVHQQLSAQDMQALIAWMRTIPQGGELHPAIKRGPQFERALEHGFQDSAAQAGRYAARRPADFGKYTQDGRYLALLACAECHGPDLKGAQSPEPGDPPDLSAAAAYSPQEFTRLMKTGVTRGGRPAAEMSTEAPKRLSVLNDEEIAAVQRYLKERSAH